MAWYQREVQEVYESLETSDTGLTSDGANERLAQYGPNKFAKEEGIKRLEILLNQFKNPLIFILIFAGLVTTYFHEYIDSGVIFAVVLINSVVGYLQEFKAERSARALKKMLVPHARVIRNGKEIEISSEDLVPGDVVRVLSGDRMPADIRLFRAVELRIDEAMLTGESVPANKVTEAIPKENLTPGDQRNMGFLGTIVVSGRGRGVVVETGQGTLLGKIATDVQEIGYVKTPLQEKFDHFAHQIGYLVFGASVLIIITGLFTGLAFKEIFTTAIAAAVATVPEGLPIVVTIAMAIGVSRMARRNAIVRKLPAVETLGSTTVICSDKTGTLTKNEMTVKLIHDGRHRFEVTGTGYEPAGGIHGPLKGIQQKEPSSSLR
jgi:Ca2+-transporting ATPase